MKVRSFILFFFLLLLPLLHLAAFCDTNYSHIEKSVVRHIHVELNRNKPSRTRAPELIISGYLESNSLNLSFNQSFRKMKIRIIDISGKVFFDDFLTGNHLITSLIDDFSTTLYIEIGSGEVKITGEIDID
ncbi:DUF3244 domain-containing protein [uncultured Bacteroides sp.]|uniref:DUF3244 domain-containing protein n=1 Tax=uncultured Bacteroides sp. TaxID=162156 RepID=UPI002AAB32BA|nr:hypothetical protein [uncultured Bacteroides sp.]